MPISSMSRVRIFGLRFATGNSFQLIFNGAHQRVPKVPLDQGHSVSLAQVVVGWWPALLGLVELALNLGRQHVLLADWELLDSCTHLHIDSFLAALALRALALRASRFSSSVRCV